MKRLIYFTYLGLLLFILFSCQKENIVPAAEAAPETAALKKGTCSSYSYSTKYGVENLGTPYPYEILVGFANNVSAQQKQQILSRQKEVKNIAGAFVSESGDEVTIVNLKPGVICSEIAPLLQALENDQNVRFAHPSFLNGGGYWDEFIAALDPSSTEQDLLQFIQSTNTSIVGFPSDFGDGIYMIRCDKNGSTDYFSMIGIFNQSSMIEYAEPAGSIFPITHKKLKKVK